MMCCYTPSVLDQACAHIGLTHMQHQAVDIHCCSNGDMLDCNNAKVMRLAYQLYVLPVLLSLQTCFAAHRARQLCGMQKVCLVVYQHKLVEACLLRVMMLLLCIAMKDWLLYAVLASLQPCFMQSLASDMKSSLFLSKALCLSLDSCSSPCNMHFPSFKSLYLVANAWFSSAQVSAPVARAAVDIRET